MSIEKDDATRSEVPDVNFREIARACRAQAYNSVLCGDVASVREWIKATEEALHGAELFRAEDAVAPESKSWVEELIDDRIMAHVRAQVRAVARVRSA